MNHIIFVDGNIGCGKSTLIENIDVKNVEIIKIYEDIEEWKRKGKLGNYYSNMKANAYNFQSYVLITRYKQLQTHLKITSTPHVFVVERSYLSNNYCFARRLYDVGLMSGYEWDLYMKLYNSLVENMDKMFDEDHQHYCFINTPYEICKERIDKRDRKEEQSITLEYLKDCEKYHLDLVEGKKYRIIDYKSPIHDLESLINEIFEIYN